MVTPLAGDLTLSSVFRVRDLDHIDALYAGTEDGFIYARDGHPNARRLAETLAELEGGEAALVVSSGMGALATLLLDQLETGDRVLAGHELYGKTHALLGRLERLGIGVRWVDSADVGAVASALSVPPRPKMLLVESLSNPRLAVARVDELAQLAHAAGALLAVDATFTPPPMLRALALGADWVLHSLTKFLSGHADVTLGYLCGRRGFVSTLATTASTFGLHAAAMDCWLTERALATLELRLQRACANATALARLLQSHPRVQAVYYPGLENHPEHHWCTRHYQGFGFMVTFILEGGREAVNRLFQNFQITSFCPSLGDVHTTVSHPVTTSHRALSEAERAKLGISAGMVRVSVGLEPFEQIRADFLQALSEVVS